MIKFFSRRYNGGDDTPPHGIPRFSQGETPVLRDVSLRRNMTSIAKRNAPKAQPELYDWANEDDAPSMMQDWADPKGMKRPCSCEGPECTCG